MAMYRKKPVIVEAWQFQISPVADWPEWLQREVRHQNVIFGNDSIFIKTLEGSMHANPGDWIIKGVKGEIYPCHPDIFAATYEPAETERLPDVEPIPQMPPGVRVERSAGVMQTGPATTFAADVEPTGPGEPIHEDDYHHPNQRATRFRDEMQQVINSHSRENGSDTPDFILSQFVLDVMDAFDRAVTRRSDWYGKDKSLEAQLQAEGEHTAAGQAEIERLNAENAQLRGELQRVSMAGLSPSMVVGK